MNLPKISIITITYNSENTLEETIKSIVSQNYPNLEYIIIDGASSDNTLAIVENYKEHITILVSEPDKGISDAFNKGIDRASGDIIGLINSDDILLPGSLKILADNYSEDIDVYRGNTMIWDEKLNYQLRDVPSMKFPLRIFKTNSICHPSTFISRKAYLKWGTYDLNYKFMMDADLLIRFYQKGAKMLYIDKDMATFRLGGVTDSSFFSKIDEIEYLISQNKGSRLLAKFIVLRFIVFQYSKKILFSLFGFKFIRKLKYK